MYHIMVVEELHSALVNLVIELVCTDLQWIMYILIGLSRQILSIYRLSSEMRKLRM